MSHYTIDYKNKSPQERHTQALADIKDYMGVERFDKINHLFRVERDEGWKPSLEGFALQLSFAGVQGYPVEAWYNEIWPYG